MSINTKRSMEDASSTPVMLTFSDGTGDYDDFEFTDLFITFSN